MSIAWQAIYFNDEGCASWASPGRARSRLWVARKSAADVNREAIEVIRGIWDVTQRRGVSVDGEYYRVRGAKRGPDPAHDISIWLGAYKPRMPQLTGTKADGWLPSLVYISPDQFGPSNKAIDEAAIAAGRDPREAEGCSTSKAPSAQPATGFSRARRSSGSKSC